MARFQMPDTRPRLLVVHDDPAVQTAIGAVAVAEGFDVGLAAGTKDAVEQVRRRRTDLVVADLDRTVAGVEFVRKLHAVDPHAKVIVITDGARHDAVALVSAGAAGCVGTPPVASGVRALLAAVRAEESERRATLTLEAELARRLEFCGMVGRSPAMQAVFSLLRRLAPHTRAVLITGEPGSGRELAARALHHLGPRRDRPFLCVDCSAVVETLFERELFGHVRDGFPSATESTAGAFETVNGGSILLKNVGELPLTVQAKLLRVIETGNVRRIGCEERRPADVQIIAATNGDIRPLVAAGRFHAHLYERLRRAEVVLPPLRGRLEDVPYLTATFVRQFAERFQKPLVGLTADAERALLVRSWEHRNVRELRQVIERACILADGAFVTEADLAGAMPLLPAPPERVVMSPPPGDAPVPLFAIERDHIVRTLEQVRGNKAVAARLLGVSRRAFYRQLERHGLHGRIRSRSRDASPAPSVVEH